MASSIDILHLFPEIAAVGQAQLQAYCHEWLRRPIAREFGFTQLVVDQRLLLYAAIDPARTEWIADRAYLPIDELLGYIIDQHFPDRDERQQLHATVRDARKRWHEHQRDYEVNVGRLGTLYFECKNPACKAVMVTDQLACENDRIEYGPVDIECLTCGQTYPYDGSNFHIQTAD